MSPNPAELAEKNIKNAHAYYKTSERVALLEKLRAIRWLEIKNEVEKRTVEETNRLWEATAEGQELIENKYKLKGLEMVIEANRSYIFILNQQAKNDSIH